MWFFNKTLLNNSHINNDVAGVLWSNTISFWSQTVHYIAEQTEHDAAEGAETQRDLCQVLQCGCGVAAINHR